MQRQISSGLSSILGILIFAVLAYFAFYMVKTLYTILLYAAPILIVAIFFLKKDVLKNWFKRRIDLIKNQPLPGILNVVASVILLPFTLVGMLFQALLTRKIDSMNQQESPFYRQESIDNQYADFEDLTDSINNSKKTVENWQIKDWDDRKQNTK